jgi:hypothetical protein
VGCPIVPEPAAATPFFGSSCVLDEGGGGSVRFVDGSVFAVMKAGFAFFVTRWAVLLFERPSWRSSAHDFVIACCGGSRLQPIKVAATAIMRGVLKRSPWRMNVRRHSLISARWFMSRAKMLNAH